MTTIVLTGASDGIGKAAAIQLRQAYPEAQLIITGRNPQKTADVAREIDATGLVADFSNLSQVKNLAEDIDSRTENIDIFVHNAGGIFEGPELTGDGFEKTWQVNVLAPLLLTNLLINKLRKSNSTIVFTSSIAAKIFARFNPDDLQSLESFDTGKAYGNAKLADAMLARELDDRYPELKTVAFHPGIIASNFSSGSSWIGAPFYRILKKTGFGSTEKGGRRLAYFAGGKEGIHYESGQFYLRPGKKGNLQPAVGHSPEVFDRISEALNLNWS